MAEPFNIAELMTCRKVDIKFPRLVLKLRKAVKNVNGKHLLLFPGQIINEVRRERKDHVLLCVFIVILTLETVSSRPVVKVQISRILSFFFFY